MRHLLRARLTLAAMEIALLAAASTAHADAAGDAALAKLDEAQNRAKTYYFEYDVTNQEPGKAEKKLAIVARIKGEKRLAEFTAPADMKGTKVLLLGASEVYVYLPAFGKVRRLTSSESTQGFMGMSFSQDDFVTRYGDRYTATVAADSGTQLQLVATAKPGQTAPYAKIELTVAKDRMLPTLLKYYNSEGKNVKTEERSSYTCDGSICTASEQKMTDLTKRGALTKLVRKKWSVNQEMSDELFSKRSLEK